MTETHWTKGPLSVFQHADGRHHEIAIMGPDRKVGTVLLERLSKIDEAVATAILFTAAPDLYQALEDAEGFVNCHSEKWYTSGQELLSEIRAALAKARGEKP